MMAAASGDSNPTNTLASSQPATQPTKLTHKRGSWSAEEDRRLLELVEDSKSVRWVNIAEMLGTRTSKQCRERYHQNLKPSLNHSPITPEEGEHIEYLVGVYGKRWAEISRHLKGRSDNAIKNWWNASANRRKSQQGWRAPGPVPPPGVAGVIPRRHSLHPGFGRTSSPQLSRLPDPSSIAPPVGVAFKPAYAESRPMAKNGSTPPPRGLPPLEPSVDDKKVPRFDIARKASYDSTLSLSRYSLTASSYPSSPDSRRSSYAPYHSAWPVSCPHSPSLGPQPYPGVPATGFPNSVGATPAIASTSGISTPTQIPVMPGHAIPAYQVPQAQFYPTPQPVAQYQVDDRRVPPLKKP